MKYCYPVSVSCGVLEVSASGYFNWLRRREDGHGRSGPGRLHSDEALLAHIRAIHAEVKGEYGWPRMHKELVARGIRVGKDRVRKLMQQHGIKAKTKRKFVVTTDSRHSLPVAPDLVQRRFNPEAPNQQRELRACKQLGCDRAEHAVELAVQEPLDHFADPTFLHLHFGEVQSFAQFDDRLRHGSGHGQSA